MVAVQLGQPFVVSGHLTVVGGVFRMQLVQPVVLVSHRLVVLGDSLLSQKYVI